MVAPKQLTPFETFVIENKGTEPAFSGMHTYTDAEGVYACKRCGAELYLSQDKFSSHCGWPSFDAEIPGAVERKPDADGRRVEILCRACGGHLGHVFEGENYTPKNQRHCVNSVSLDFIPKSLARTEVAVFASGCFWGTQYFLARVPGVMRTTVGYIGGHVENPTYEQVCGKNTGHYEALEVEFDSSKVSYEKLLKLFFETHDFSQEDGQGPDIGPQYRSAVFPLSDAQKQTAEHVFAQLHGMKRKVATSVLPASKFWPAENYHQNYYERKGDSPYCHVYRKVFAD